MTAPTGVQFERRNHGRGHSYWLNGRKLPGVTTILGNALRARALENWSAEVTAAWAVNHWEELGTLPLTERLTVLRRARYDTRDAAALNGTQIHAHAERMVAGQPVEVPDTQLGAVQALARWMDQVGLEPILVERPVVHLEHQWAGTFDLVGTIAGQTWLLDWKTGKGVYAEATLQLAAYAHATHVLTNGGVLVGWTPPERVGAVHITSDAAELLEVDASDAQYLVFRYCQQIAAWADRVAAARDQGESWPVGEPA